MLKLTKSAVSVDIFQDGWSVRGNSPLEDLKVFIDVNVETVTNAELLLWTIRAVMQALQPTDCCYVLPALRCIGHHSSPHQDLHLKI